MVGGVHTSPNGDDTGSMDDEAAPEDGGGVRPGKGRDDESDNIETAPDSTPANSGHRTATGDGSVKSPRFPGASPRQGFDVDNTAAGFEAYTSGMSQLGGESLRDGWPLYTDDPTGTTSGVEAEVSQEHADPSLDLTFDSMEPKHGDASRFDVTHERRGGNSSGDLRCEYSAGGNDQQVEGNENAEGRAEVGDVGSEGSRKKAKGRDRELFDGSGIAEQQNEARVVYAGEGADNIPGVDDLPVFANEQSKALNDEIKVNK